MQSLRKAIVAGQLVHMHSDTEANTPPCNTAPVTVSRGIPHELGHTGLALTDVSRRQIAPTLLISAGAIVLLMCSTAFETPGRNKQIRHRSTTLVMQALVGDLSNKKIARIPPRAIQTPIQPELTANLNAYWGHLNWMEVARSNHHLGMPAAMLVCKTMHWRNSSKWQGCTESTSITCVHKAVARNSLTYLTALDTPDRRKIDKRIKEEMKIHSWNQSQSCKKKTRAQIGKQTYKSASVWYWAAE